MKYEYVHDNEDRLIQLSLSLTHTFFVFSLRFDAKNYWNVENKQRIVVWRKANVILNMNACYVIPLNQLNAFSFKNFNKPTECEYEIQKID